MSDAALVRSLSPTAPPPPSTGTTTNLSPMSSPPLRSLVTLLDRIEALSLPLRPATLRDGVPTQTHSPLCRGLTTVQLRPPSSALIGRDSQEALSKTNGRKSEWLKHLKCGCTFCNNSGAFSKHVFMWNLHYVCLLVVAPEENTVWVRAPCLWHVSLNSFFNRLQTME